MKMELTGPLAELPLDVQARIVACVPDSEIEMRGGQQNVSARGMIALMEGVKRYGPPEIAEEADWAIKEMLKAANEFKG